jgi:valyl-tRNA synthetase
MPKTYDPASTEPRLIQDWIEGGCYQRSKGVGDCTVVIPPPNVTGMLHMGHAMDDTIQDTLVRFNRMRGVSTRWILGTDHAGIATQTKVDKHLKEQGISRLEIGRERFVDACQDWRREYGGIIVEQIKRMGCSIDFADEKFTMSPEYARAVRKVFCDWYHAGLIYRGKRIVNWCPSCTTAISDDEAEYSDEPSHLWHLRYPLAEPVDGIDYITVATTRPETMLGDTGVAVSPEDPEKAKLVGHTVMLPIVNREIPIFSDWHVDKDFGTGFVKVTPAHDPNDFAMGAAHDLPQINVFDEHAVVVPRLRRVLGHGPRPGARGHRRLVRRARPARPHRGHRATRSCTATAATRPSSRGCPSSGSWPWTSSRARPPKVVEDGEVTFYPERWKQTYLTWMENLKDWCISRQLWWGHRIPVFYCDDCGWEDALMEDADVCPKCGGHHVRQDEDVLDTWFSSQLWTFATQGWPERPEEMEGHHPTTVLVTARDIIALWVARMIMSSLYFTHEVPFHDVFIYATILAKDGSRMSKSKGNGVDPMQLIDTYGADAMRFNLLTLVTNNQDVRFDAVTAKDGTITSARTDASRAFVTKIWNASRFVLMNMEGYTPGPAEAATPEDAWMLSRLAKMVGRATSDIEAYDLGDYARSLQTFFWNDLCDWYIELCKGRLLHGAAEERLQVQRNLAFVLDSSLRLLHPVMPFVTEAIWDAMPASGLDGEPHDGRFLMQAAWPDPASVSPFENDGAEHDFEIARRVVELVRSARARYRLSPKEELDVCVKVSADDAAVIESQASFVRGVGRVGSLEVGQDVAKPEGSVSFVDAGMELYVVLGGLVDLAGERARLEKELAASRKDLAGVERTLANPGFVAKAAPQVIEAKKARQADLATTIAQLEAQISDLG